LALGIVDDYTSAVYDERKFFAAYPPNTRLELGTYGELRGKRFIPAGSLRHLRNPLLLEAAEQPVDRGGYRNEFRVKDARAVKVGAGVSVDVPGVTTTKAALKVEFSAGFGAYVGLAEMLVVTPRDLSSLQAELIRRAQLPQDDPDHWDSRYRIVTSLLTATKVTVLMSRTSGSKIVLQAKGDVPSVDLGNADVALDTLFVDTSEDQFVPESSASADRTRVTPFFWLMRVNLGLLGLGRGKTAFESHRAASSGVALEPEGSPFDLASLER
jgi:hypothetical protein